MLIAATDRAHVAHGAASPSVAALVRVPVETHSQLRHITASTRPNQTKKNNNEVCLRFEDSRIEILYVPKKRKRSAAHFPFCLDLATCAPFVHLLANKRINQQNATAHHLPVSGPSTNLARAARRAHTDTRTRSPLSEAAATPAFSSLEQHNFST